MKKKEGRLSSRPTVRAPSSDRPTVPVPSGWPSEHLKRGVIVEERALRIRDPRSED